MDKILGNLREKKDIKSFRKRELKTRNCYQGRRYK